MYFSLVTPLLAIYFSVSTKSDIWEINQKSYLVISQIFFTDIPFLRLSAIKRNLYGKSIFRRFNNLLFLIFLNSIGVSKPFNPISKLLIAFWKDSLKFFPIDMHSPIDFIAVPSLASVLLNFSKVNLGILVTI